MKGTPTVAINGVMQDAQANPDDLNWSAEGALLKFVQDAAGK